MLQTPQHPSRELLWKILRLPIFHSKPVHSDFQFIIDNMHARLNGWKTNFLNMAGRTVLAKASLASIHSHVMHYISFPSRITTSIDKIQKNFIWGTTPEKKKMHLISRDTVTKPKHYGGLGLQKCHTKNQVLHAGLSWRMYKIPQALCTRVLYYKHCQRKISLSWKHPVSRTWQCIKKGWEICNKGTRWIVNKGNCVNFFEDRWILHEPIRSLIHGPLNVQDHNWKISFLRSNGRLNLNDLSLNLPEEQIRKITDSFIPITTNMEDNLIWVLTRDGTFTTKSAHKLIDHHDHNHSNQTYFSWVWKIQAPEKIKIFMWLFSHNRLPTSHYLQSIGLNVDPTCYFCRRDQ